MTESPGTFLTGVIVLTCITANGSAETDFRNDVYPLLAQHCFRCHQGKNPESGVRLDTRENILDTELAVIGVGNQSKLIALVSRVDPDQAMQEAQVGIYLAIQQVEAYKAENQGQLPSSLEEVGADGPGLVFVRDTQGYQIVADVDGTIERYTEGEDTSRFESAATALFRPEGS